MNVCTLAILSVVISVGVACSGFSRDDSREIFADTTNGTLRGVVSIDGMSQSFKGVPFAMPPIGNLRWKAPQSVAPWSGVRDATSFAARGIQGRTNKTFRDSGPSEDCLYLNVWIPNNASEAPLPVMVWFYGGGFSSGGTSEPRQDGTKLCQKGVIVVSAAYRMGIFGFMAHPELTKESPVNASGNYGLLDMVAALGWVNRNIESFGGDPDNVTIFGESAGSYAVSALMASPLSKGMFQKAIGESGSMLNPLKDLDSREVAESKTVEFVREIFGPSTLTELRAMAADDLLQEAWKGNRQRFWPIVDGYFLPNQCRAIFAEGEQAIVPLLAGWNIDEGKPENFLKNEPLTLSSYRSSVKERFGERAEAFLGVYPATNDEEAIRAAADYIGDDFIAYGTWKWIEEHARTSGAPVWRYRFDQTLPLSSDAPRDSIPRAAHAWEIEYVFNTLDSKPLPWRQTDRVVSEMMANYWTNFAKTGDPNGSGLVRWPAYNSIEDGPVLLLDSSPEVVSDPGRKRFEFWESGNQ